MTVLHAYEAFSNQQAKPFINTNRKLGAAVAAHLPSAASVLYSL